MNAANSQRLLQHICRLAGGPSGTPPDGELLRRYLHSRDETAFTALVRRHGPMVFSVCQSVLRQREDAEDAFQATFLVLAQRSGSIRRHEGLGGWLQRVAYHIALRARARKVRRQSQEAKAIPTAAACSACDDLSWGELRSILHAELAALPEQFRAALVLCYLEGLTQEEAAQRLGWTAATVKGRLQRGREKLRRRLERRGVALTAALGAALTGQTLAEAAVPSTAVPTAAALALASSFLRPLLPIKLALLLSLGVVAGGVALRLPSGPRPSESGIPNRSLMVAAPKAIDVHGDPLPQGAIARMGSLRLRHAGLSDFVFLRGGEMLVSAGGSVLRFWDMPTGKLVREVRLQDAIGPWQVALSPNGQTVAALTQKSLCFWQVDSGKQLQKIVGQPESAAFLHFSPDGKLLAIGTWDGKISLWEWEKKKERRLSVPPRKLGIDSAFHGCFSPDGKWFVAGGGWDSPLGVYEVATGREVRRLDCSASISAVSADSKRLAVASMKNDKGVAETVLRFFELDSGKETVQYPLGHRDSYFSLAFCSDGKHLACGRSYRSCLLDCASGRVVHHLSGFPQKLMFAPDGKTLSATAGPRIRMWNVATGRDREDGMGNFEPALSISPDGRILAAPESGEPAVSLWDTATGRFLRVLPVKEGGHTVKSLAFLPDGKSLFAGQNNGTLRFWDVAGGKEQRTLQLRDQIRPNPHDVFFHQFQVSDDDKRVSTLEWFGARNESTRLALWDLDSGKLLSQQVMPPWLLPTYSVLETAWSVDAATLTLRRSDGLTQMRVQSGAIRFRIPSASNVRALAASPDGQLLAAARRAEGKHKAAVGIWEAVTGKEIASMTIGPVSQLALAPDDRHLVAADENSLRVWDLATGEERRRWLLPEANTAPGGNPVVTRLLLSPDGRRAFTAMNDGTVLVWDVQPALRRGKPLAGKLGEKELAAWWTDLAGEDAPRVYAALWRLTETPEATMPFLRRHLRPATDAEIQAIRRAIANLDSNDFATREKAFTELAQLGPLAELMLHQALAQKPTLEARRRMRDLLEKIDQQPSAGEALRLLRTLQVLANTGAEGRRLLRELAKGTEGAWLTRQAQAALARLNRLTP